MTIDWKKANKEFKNELEDQTIQLSLSLQSIIPQALKAEGFEPDFGGTTEKLLREVAFQSSKDLIKIRLYQQDDVDIHKMVAYVCFWIRKVKPIPAYPVNGKARVDINERLSLWMMSAIITRMYQKRNDPRLPQVSEKFKKFFAITALFDYVVHSLRYRTFGPHHYVIIMRLIADI
jgi:hypothetical protein